ncbi:MAG: GspE/PulE family protein [Thermoguttaceae bacterium]|jgi:general secretion pathway protein E/type IV pilus assembly protein PilB|nr:GspE/PulE family protein [Thermoguttaceae bacterium]
MIVFFEQEERPLKLNAVQMRIARASFEEDGKLLQPVLNQLGARTEEIALDAIAQRLGLPVVDLAKTTVPNDVLVNFPTKIIHRRNVFPLGVQSDGALYVATSNPFDLSLVDEVSAATDLPTILVVAYPNELTKLIKSRLGVGAETIDGLIEQTSDVEILEEVDWDQGDAQGAQEASVVRLVNDILTEAVESGTSDVHIEAQETGMRIRYRIDGVLQTQPTPPEINRFQSAIVSRIKIMSRLNIAEKRIPQDGRIKLKVQNREVDLRVSIIPMLHGEGIVMRILDKDRMNFTLRGIGMDEDVYQEFGKLISLPHGIILVTGPTGSGKTTTLYSALNEIKSDETKIITTEDPIEYQLDGINQIQVHTKVGLTFAASLRAILRHDPDVVLVGEIRDFETAENAIQASMTGHLVFSTLHTNDAAGAYTRMIDMGVEPFLVGATVEGIMAQRLARRLCKHCKEPWNPKPENLPEDFPKELLESGSIYRPVGCRECRDTGYAGRVALYELLIPDDEIRRLAGDKAPAIEVKKVARANGMATLRDNGWKKVGLGITSVEEVVRVAKED